MPSSPRKKTSDSNSSNKTLRIDGFPSGLAKDEVEELVVNAVGPVRKVKVEEAPEGTLSCVVKFKSLDAAEKARKNFHDLKIGNAVTTVTDVADEEVADDYGGAGAALNNASSPRASFKKKSRTGSGELDGGGSSSRRKTREGGGDHYSRSRSRSRSESPRGKGGRSSRRIRSRSRSPPSRSRSRSDSRDRRRGDKKHHHNRRDEEDRDRDSSSKGGRERKSRFAPPPTNPALLAGVPGVGLSNLPPTVAAGLVAQGITSLPVMGEVTATAMALAATQTPLKTQLELFVGNTPTACSQQALPDFLNAAMKQVGLAKGPGEPITAARMSNKFAFVTFRSVEECSAALNMNGIPFMGNFLKIQRPSSYRGPPDTSRVTWQVLTGQAAPELVPPQLDPTTKTRRELFVGNMPPDAQGNVIQEYLGNAMSQVGLTTEEGNPIVNVRMNNRFCFLEFRSVEECSNALNMNNIPFMGASLNLARPAKYDGPPTAHKSWFDMLATSSALAGGGATPVAGMGGGAAAATEPLSPCIKIGNVVDEEELASDEDYNDVLADMKEECGKYGSVEKIVIPRGAEEGKGFVFVCYSSQDEALKAKTAFGSRTFDGNPVLVSFIPKEEFESLKASLS